MNASISFFWKETKWVWIAGSFLLLFFAYSNVKACEQRINIQTGNTVLFGADCTLVGVSPPMVLGSNGYYPQGSNPQQHQQFVTAQNGQQIGIPQGVAAGQMFSQMVNGREYRCSWGDRVVSAVEQGGLMALVGYAGDRIAAGRNQKTSFAKDLGLVGVAAGATVTCTPGAYQELKQEITSNGSGQMQQQGLQQVAYQQNGRQSPISEHQCVRAGKKHDCQDSFPVFEGGAVVCYPKDELDGKQRCSGIQ